MRIAIIEDDKAVASQLLHSLSVEGDTCHLFNEAASFLAALPRESFDACIVDLMLPGMDGKALVRLLRERKNPLPVMVLTSQDAESEVISALDAGADDYILKPFEISELLARMRAVLRRHGGVATPVLTSAMLTLDPATREASAHGQPPVQLSNREFALLHALMQRPGAILSRADLEDRVYGWGEEVESNAIEYLIHSLRKKLGSEAIRNIRGAGWMVSKQA